MSIEFSTASMEERVINMIKNAGPFELTKLVVNAKLTFDPSLKLQSKWTKFNHWGIMDWYFVGQVNDRNEPHGICKMKDERSWRVVEGQFVNG